MRGKRSFQLALVFILLLIGGCNSALPSAPTVGGTVHSPSDISRTAAFNTPPSSTAIIYPTRAEPTVSSTINISDTPTPTESSTSSPPTWTPLPTLSKETVKEFVIELLKTNAGCELPCYWGIVPGETSWEEAQHFFSSFTDRIGQAGSSITTENGIEYLRTGYSIYNKIVGYSDDISSSYGVVNGIIDKVIVAPRGTELLYQLHQVLERYGEPEEVAIWLQMTDAPPPEPHYVLILFYPQKGVVAYYESDVEKRGDSIRICPQGLGPRLFLLSPDELTVNSLKRLVWDYPATDLISIEDVPGMTLESFYDQMKVVGSCLTVPPLGE